MGPGEGGSQCGALLQHGPDFSFPAGVLGSVELVLASQGPVQDPGRGGKSADRRRPEAIVLVVGWAVTGGNEELSPEAWVSSESSWVSSKQTLQLGS